MKPTVDGHEARPPLSGRPSFLTSPRSDRSRHLPIAIHPFFRTARQPFTNHPPTTRQPRHNHPSCRIHERFQHNHPTFAILQIRQRRAAWPWLVHQLLRSPRRFLHHPRREGYRQAAGNAIVSADGDEKRKPLVKRAFRGVCPPSFERALRQSGVATKCDPFGSYILSSPCLIP